MIWRSGRHLTFAEIGGEAVVVKLLPPTFIQESCSCKAVGHKGRSRFLLLSLLVDWCPSVEVSTYDKIVKQGFFSVMSARIRIWSDPHTQGSRGVSGLLCQFC